MIRHSLIPAIFCVTGLSASLVPCPDCERMVSRHAFMCPNCGCRGEMIAEAAKSIPEPQVGDILDVDCDGQHTCALPVDLDGRRFAVLPLDQVLGVSRIQLSQNGRPIAWSIPELAIDAPIVRLQIAATNITYWVPGGRLNFDGTRIKANGNEVAAIVSPLIGTNAYALTGRQWEIFQPKQMKVHGQQVRKMLNGKPYELPQRTHPYFKKLEKQITEKEQ